MPKSTGAQQLEAWRAFSVGEPATTVAALVRRAVEDGRIFQGQPPLHAVGIAVYLLFCADELDAAARAVDEFSAAAPASGSTIAAACAMGLRAGLAQARGDLARAAQPDGGAAVEALREAGLLVTFAPYLGGRIEILIEREEFDAAERELVAAGLSGAVPDHLFTTRVLHARGCLRLAEGRTEEGYADFAELARRARRDGLKNVTAFSSMAVAAIEFARLREGRSARGLIELGREQARAWGAFAEIALTGLGRGNPGRAFADIYLRGARKWGTPRVIGTGLHAMGVVRGGEKGIELLREAVTTLEGSPARLEHAKALTDLGAALRRANRRAEAREPLRAALEMARRGGALAVARRAHEELEATGERLTRFAPVGVESLTPSERRIADLAADGLTNRQIAQTLSVKTVESHLRGAYRKLDISSRGELSSALRTGDSQNE